VVDEAKIAALVNKLCGEFANELKDLRGDVDGLQDDVSDLSDRVAYLEEQNKGPKVFGWLDYRIGQTGRSVDLDNEYDNMTAMVGVQGKITNDVSGRIALKVRDWSDTSALVDGNSGEALWLDEATISANSKFILPATWTLGRQFQSYGMGLLVDNERKAQQGIRIQVKDIFSSNLDLDVFGGGVDNTIDIAHDSTASGNFPNIDPSVGGHYPTTDGYASGRLAYTRPSWSLAGNYLATGMNDERGYSVDLAATIWDRDIRVEWANLDTDAWGNKDSHLIGNDALMGSADLWRSSNWRLTGFYSHCDSGYTTGYSNLNPYYEALRPTPGIAWEKWLRNPLVLNNKRVLGAHLDFNVGSLPFNVAYFDVKANSGPNPFDTLWAIGTSKQLADGVTANLTYGQQLATAPKTPDQQLLQASVSVGF
jgi:hypothetical protein